MWEIYEVSGNRQIKCKETYDVHAEVSCMIFRTPPFVLLFIIHISISPPADPHKVASTQFAAATIDGNVFTIAEDSDQELCVAKFFIILYFYSIYSIFITSAFVVGWMEYLIQSSIMPVKIL